MSVEMTYVTFTNEVADNEACGPASTILTCRLFWDLSGVLGCFGGH